MFGFYIGYVSEISDELQAGRIKAVIPSDKGLSSSEVPYSFPFMPKIFHVVPKVGEAVLVIIQNDKEPNAQRYYIGPIISQPQNMNYDGFENFSATKLLNGGLSKPDISVKNNAATNDIYPMEDEVAVMGRKSSEIILGDDDVRIRCGVRNASTATTKESKQRVNTSLSIRTAPAFIKLQYYPEPLKTTPKAGEINAHKETISTATIVADKINLISPNGDGGFSLPGDGNGISENKMKEIIEKAHKLPYGDVLCDILSMFLAAFQSHYHQYHMMPPDPTAPNVSELFLKYSSDKSGLEDKLLSKDIRIN